MPTKKQEEFLEKMRRRININALSDEYILQIQTEGLINEIFIDNKNLTLLMYYVKNFNLDRVKFLLNPPVCAKTTVISKVNQLNALAIAINGVFQDPENLLIVDELLKHDPKEQVLQKNKQGMIPVHFAAKEGDLRLVQKLLEHSPHEQLKIKDELNQDSVISYAIMSKNYELIIWLLDTYPYLLNEVLKDGFTLLHLASKNGDQTLMKILFERGDKKALRQIPNAAGRIALSVACSHGHIEAAKDLLKLNPSKQLAALDNNGYNVFHTACLHQSEEFLKLFLEHAKPEYLSAMLNKQTPQGHTPLRIAVVFSNENPNMLSLIRLLIEAGSKISFELFEIAIRNNNFLVIEALLSYEFKLNIPDKAGKTVLNDALYLKKPKVVAMLLAAGADPNLTIMDTTGKVYSPLLMATWGPDFESIKLLKQYGANTTPDIIQFVVNTYGQKQNIYKKFKEVMSELPDIHQSLGPVKASEKDNSAEPSIIPSLKYSTSGRQNLLSQGYTIDDIEMMRKSANTTPAWTLQKDKQKPIAFLDGSIDSTHPAILAIENSKCYCYLDAVTLRQQGFNIEDLKISRFKFGPDTIKLLDKDKGVFKESIKLSEHSPAIQRQYTHELKINDLDRIFMIQEGPLFIGIKYVPGGVHTQGQINAVHGSNKENRTGLEVRWPEGITPGLKMNGMLSAAL